MTPVARHAFAAAASCVVLMLASGCDEIAKAPKTPPAPAIAAPLDAAADPLAVAAANVLPDRKPQELAGLHHVNVLSENVIVGSEPDGAAAWESLKSLGVKTILSVDGKSPEFETAAAAGLRYVHVPILYKGIPVDAARRIVKAFQELPKPFYVHCYHGLHRGPAAASLGRIALDGASREQVLAEMLQWCGTSKGYPGLYRAAARLEVPAAAESAKLGWDFTPDPEAEGMQGAMIGVSRADGALKHLSEHAFAADPDHPDVDAAREAETLASHFDAALAVKDPVPPAQAEAFRTWMQDSASLSRSLASQLKAKDTKAAGETYKKVRGLCSTCHKAHRDS